MILLDGCTFLTNELMDVLQSFIENHRSAIFILVGAFLREESTIVMAFRQCFFDTPEVTKTVLPKLLKSLTLYLLVQGIEPKRLSFFPRIIKYLARLKYPPFKFFRHCETLKFFSFSGAPAENTMTL